METAAHRRLNWRRDDHCGGRFVENGDISFAIEPQTESAFARAFGPAYHSRPNGRASEIRSTPRGQEPRSVQAKISRKKGTLSYPAIVRPCAIVDDETKRKDHVLTLGVEEEFQMIAVGFGLSEFRKSKSQSA